jgi:hypothetical protein
MAADEDIPLGDAARHYERQFGDRIRQVQKRGARPPAGGTGGSGGSGTGRGAVWAVLVLVFIVIRVVISVSSSSSRNSSPSYNFTPPRPQVDFEQQRRAFAELDKLQRDAEQREQGWKPLAPALLDEGPGPSYRFEEGDVPLPEGLCYRIVQEARGANVTPGSRLEAFLDARGRDLVGRAARGEQLGAAEVRDLRAALNAVLDKREFYDERYFRGLDLPPEAQALAAKSPARLAGRVGVADVRKLNRLALEAAYPRQIVAAALRGVLGPQLEQETARADLAEARRKYEPAKP